MLPTHQKMSREEFSDVFSNGTRIHTPHIGLIYTKSTDMKAAVVVSKKVHKSAVKRNKLRRQTYALLRDMSLCGHYIFIMKPRTAALTYIELQNELARVVGMSARSR